MPDQQYLTDDQRMQGLRAKAVAAMDELNKAHPSHGGQAFVRGPNGVHLINPDGTVHEDIAAFNAKTGMYEPTPQKTMSPEKLAQIQEASKQMLAANKGGGIPTPTPRPLVGPSDYIGPFDSRWDEPGQKFTPDQLAVRQNQIDGQNYMAEHGGR